MVKLLHQYPANLKRRGFQNKTTLSLALERGDQAVILLIKERTAQMSPIVEEEIASDSETHSSEGFLKWKS